MANDDDIFYDHDDYDHDDYDHDENDDDHSYDNHDCDGDGNDDDGIWNVICEPVIQMNKKNQKSWFQHAYQNENVIEE